MKRFLRFGIPAIILLAVVVLGMFVLQGKGFSEGICLMADSGSYIIVMDDSPVVMSNRTGDENAFSDLNTGDRLWILHDGIHETYPGQTGVYLVLRTGSGHTEEIPAEVLDSLRQMGWIS